MSKDSLSAFLVSSAIVLLDLIFLISGLVYDGEVPFTVLPSWPENWPSGFPVDGRGESGELLKAVWATPLELLYEYDRLS